jgi:hypothetical protein
MQLAQIVDIVVYLFFYRNTPGEFEAPWNSLLNSYH